jgi:glutamyl-tRNA synthetase
MATKIDSVRVRIAPSPTGSPHLATAYQAIFNKAFALKNEGVFVLRIEDTDRKRYLPESEKEIFTHLRWLGLDWDEGPQVSGPYGPYRQSERLEIYQKYAARLVEKGAAYYCLCSPERLEKMRKQMQKEGKPPRYDRHCRGLDPEKARARVRKGEAATIRLKVPLEGETTFTDLIRGEITMQNASLDDQILLKSDGYPTYHLAVVVDDHLMKITHIIRGEEWLSSVPKHVLIYRALGWEMPVMAHTPILRDEKGRKLSKRFGSTAISWYREQGFLPQALKNYLALLGWSHPEEKEIFTFEEFAAKFTPERIRPTAPVFDLKKLEWMNGHYLRSLPPEVVAEALEPFSPPGMDAKLRRAVVPLVSERMKRMSEFAAMTAFLTRETAPSREDLVPKKLKKREAKTILETTRRELGQIGAKAFKGQKIEEKIRRLVAEGGWPKGAAFMSIRVAVTGQKITPPLFASIALLGKEKALERLQKAVNLLEDN